MPFDSVDAPMKTLVEVGLPHIANARVERWKRYCLRTPKVQWTSSAPMDLANFLHFCPSAPADVKRLAARIVSLIPTVQFSVEFCGTDPVLWAHYGHRRQCVAIWHKRIIRAIAYGAELSSVQRLLQRVVKTV